MTCTPEQVKKLMQYRQMHTQETAAAKAGMSLRSARSYLKGKPIRRSLQRSYRTRKDPFAEAWDDIKKMLSKDPGLEARTLLEWLIDREPAKYSLQSLRTLPRCVTGVR